MGITDVIRSDFSSAVRQRGQKYARSGAVHLREAANGWAEMDVEGSGDWYYSVTLERHGHKDYQLECTCPHFDDGFFCKHIWAAALVADEKELFGPSLLVTASNGKQSNKKQADWKKQLVLSTSRVPSRNWDTNTDHTPREVYYLLETATGGATPTINLYQRQRRKDGEWGTIKPLGLSYSTLGDLEAPEDRAVIDLLFGNHVLDERPDRFGYYNYDSSLNANRPTQIEVGRGMFDTIFPALAKTGRFKWLLAAEQGWDEARTLTWNPDNTWKFRIRAEEFDRKRKWRLFGEITCGKQVRPVSDLVQWYFSGLLLMDDQLCLFEPPTDMRWVETLRRCEHLVIPKSDRETFIQELWQIGTPPEIAGDESLRLTSETGVPVGRLVVHPPRDLPGYRRDRHLYASVGYLYGEHEASPNSQVAAWPDESGDTMLQRDLTAEEALLARLYELGLVPKETSYYGDTPPGHLQFLPKKLEQIVEALVAEGWIVESEGTRVRSGGSLSVSVKSGIDWFDLEGEVDFDGESVQLPELLAALREGERYVRLGDGSRGLLPADWLARYAPLADLASTEEKGKLRFQTSQALLLDSLLAGRESEIAVQFDKQFSTWRKRLKSFQGVKPVTPTKTFRGELRDYQQEGLGWLRFLEKFGFGGCLADDMGLGKTVQVLALLADRRRRRGKASERQTSLVVAPKSLVHNWILEAERFSPRLNVADYTGLDRKERVGKLTDYDLVLTTYGTLRRDAAELGKIQWDYAILDEAQAIKNPASQSAKACRLLSASHRLALSGTPVENHLGELWSIFEYLNPGLLGKSKAFQKLHKGVGDEERHEKLTAIREGIAPFLLRRTKQQVLPQLPKKTEQSLYCELNTTERKQYNELRDHYRASLSQKIADSSLAKAKIHVLEALLRLRQAACHPGLIDAKKKSKPSTKLTLLLDQLTEVVEEGHKALVFSQFTTMLDIVRKQFDDAGIVYEYLDGKTRKRQQCIDRFQTDDTCQAFLISLKAGGCGLNLTAADYVFLLDPWWNPAVESQAIDRAHRIGQERPVFAYRLIARDTVEEKILEMQANKRELADAIVAENSSLLKSLSADDLQRLLS